MVSFCYTYNMNIIFICHGNICRSPVAEIIFSDLAKENNLDINVSSRATSLEEIGNDIYPPMRRVLHNHGYIDVHHSATRISRSEFESADYIFYMDKNNLYYLERLFGPSDKYHLITEYLDNIEIEDPWYTNRFEYVYQRIKKAVEAIIKQIKK